MSVCEGAHHVLHAAFGEVSRAEPLTAGRARQISDSAVKDLNGQRPHGSNASARSTRDGGLALLKAPVHTLACRTIIVDPMPIET